jgi:hypothetical protein
VDLAAAEGKSNDQQQPNKVIGTTATVQPEEGTEIKNLCVCV